MNDNRRFKKGSGVYTCHHCHKETRDTGKGEAQFELCAACFEIESQWNEHSDDDHPGEIWDCEQCLKSLSKAARDGMEKYKTRGKATE